RRTSEPADRFAPRTVVRLACPPVPVLHSHSIVPIIGHRPPRPLPGPACAPLLSPVVKIRELESVELWQTPRESAPAPGSTDQSLRRDAPHWLMVLRPEEPLPLSRDDTHS